jgi:phytoene synthase
VIAAGAAVPSAGIVRPEAAHCMDLVREADRDRYLATLLAAPDRQPGLFALYAFNQEITRVRDIVSDPLPGEMRLQWWRYMLGGEARGEVSAHPVAAALADAVLRYRLPRQALLDLIDARVFDLYDDPMPSVNDLEGYCGETSSSLIRLSCLILAGGADPGGADAAGHAGVAYAITGLLRALPWHSRRGQCYLPLDILAEHGLDREDIVGRKDGPALRSALADMRGVARRHRDQAMDLIGAADPVSHAAFLPVVLVEPYLRIMEGKSYDPFRSVVDLPQWRRQWILWRASRQQLRRT